MKILFAISVLVTLLCVNVHAKDNEMWVAGFIEDYSTDPAEAGLPYFLDNGAGLGWEFGMKFTPQWAARFEVSRLDINTFPSDESGSRMGVDIFYFLQDDLFYVFGGLKNTEIVNAYTMGNLGIGKHWDVTENFKILTEGTAYRPIDSSDSNIHYGLKLGVAFVFGGSTKTSVPKSIDSDSDGVFDKIDQCVSTPINTRVDNVGCSLDSDSDGVLNTIDMCPDTLVGKIVGRKGCTLVLDIDQDGVLDIVDQCAGTPMRDKVDTTGCSVFTVEEASINLKVLFPNNSSIIGNPNDVQFQKFADFMNRFPTTDAVIEGHTCVLGNADYNMMFSIKRANSVRTLLISKYGINAARLTAIGFGETQLLDTATTVQANKVNRRITARVSVTKKVKMQR